MVDVAADNSYQECGVLNDKLRLVTTLSATLIACFPDDVGDAVASARKIIREGHTHRKRERKSVNKIFYEHGPGYTRRAYRMNSRSFWKLEKMLRPRLCRARTKRAKEMRKRDGARNGRISAAIRLSAAIRYFAGGRPDDISLSHGISHSEVFNSVWLVVDAVISHPKLAFSYPSDHNSQRAIAKGFKALSTPGFDNCAGCIDGMLLWTEKPTEASCIFAQCQPKSFFCGRKSKFGLNFQGICDYRGRFLDVACGSPASTSDFLAFTVSKIYLRLEDDLLAPGLCLYGDAAYVNNRYMATPFKSVSSGSKFDYNHFHSQVSTKRSVAGC